MLLLVQSVLPSTQRATLKLGTEPAVSNQPPTMTSTLFVVGLWRDASESTWLVWPQGAENPWSIADQTQVWSRSSHRACATQAHGISIEEVWKLSNVPPTNKSSPRTAIVAIPGTANGSDSNNVTPSIDHDEPFHTAMELPFVSPPASVK